MSRAFRIFGVFKQRLYFIFVVTANFLIYVKYIPEIGCVLYRTFSDNQKTIRKDISIMKRTLSVFLAALTSISIVSAFPVYACDCAEEELPVLLCTKCRKDDIQALKRTKPKLTANSRNDSYYYYGSYESRTLKWSPVDNALLYYIYAKPSNKKSYEKIGSTCNTEFYTTYTVTTSYIIKAVSFDTEDRKILSRSSNEITLKYRANRKPDYIEYDECTDCEDGYYEEEEICEEADVIEAEVSAPVLSTETRSEIYRPVMPDVYPNTEEYAHVTENSFKLASTDPVSTFSADVDTASYANIRRLIRDGDGIPEDAVRIEEMINYFDYDYPVKDKSGFSVYSEITDCPWNKSAKLLHLGITAPVPEEKPDSNLVFLVDVSGSMYDPVKLPLVKEALSVLTDNMTEKDKISIVTYSGEEKTVLAGAGGNCKKAVTELAESLDAEGSTNGERGIITAYEIAEKYFIEGGNNRIILCSDGDLNVGISDTDELKELIGEKRESGIYFTVLGFGKGNLKDEKMEALADNGNGSYHYIDCAEEAVRVLDKECTENLITAAKDVKLQTEFNPDRVKSYRLIGYDNRRLENSDFTDDSKDAGEMGSGQSITVLYEIIPSGGKAQKGLKYQKSTGSEEWCTVKVRYKKPEQTVSKQFSFAVDDSFVRENLSDNMKLSASAAMFGMYLKNSGYKGSSSPENALSLIKDCDNEGAAELRELIEIFIESKE